MKDNKLIAEFMGMQHTDIGWYDNEETLQLQNNTFDELQFHTSWHWLMPVVDKIEDYLSDNVGKVGYFDECLSSNDLEVRYNAVVEFINQYNKNK